MWILKMQSRSHYLTTISMYIVYVQCMRGSKVIFRKCKFVIHTLASLHLLVWIKWVMFWFAISAQWINERKKKFKSWSSTLVILYLRHNPSPPQNWLVFRQQPITNSGESMNSNLCFPLLLSLWQKWARFAFDLVTLNFEWNTTKKYLHHN